MLFSFFTTFLEPVAYLLYFIAVFVHRKSNLKKSPQILLVFYLVATVVHTVGSVTMKLGFDNLWSYDLVALFTAVFIGLYFYRLFQSPTKKITILALIGIYLLHAIYRNLILEGPRFFDSFGYAIVSASVAIYVFMYFHSILKNVTEANILKEFNFWLASGYLVYYVGSFIIFVSYYYFTIKIIDTYTQPERDVLTALWGMHNVLLFVSASALLISCLWATSRKKSV